MLTVHDEMLLSIQVTWSVPSVPGGTSSRSVTTVGRSTAGDDSTTATAAGDDSGAITTGGGSETSAIGFPSTPMTRSPCETTPTAAAADGGCSSDEGAGRRRAPGTNSGCVRSGTESSRASRTASPSSRSTSEATTERTEALASADALTGGSARGGTCSGGALNSTRYFFSSSRRAEKE